MTASVETKGIRAFARAFGVALLAFVIFLGPLSTAAEAITSRRHYAGIVVDAKTGETLYSYAADAKRYPASVTKVMTLYILFEELKAGRLTLNSRLRISPHAAAAVPTKLGLKAGSTIRVEDAIKAVVTLSANDIAGAIAENIAGSESAFAKRMTKTARALGMNHTTYVNASGLPDSRQLTTARDQARLGVAIYQHFPDYYKYFQTRVFSYQGRKYGNHNRLLGHVPGVDGIKTGYINASGYNLLTAARINNRHIVVVGFGFNTGASRNAKVASLVRKYLPKARRGSVLRVAEIPRPFSGGTVRVATAVTPAPAPSFRTPAPIPVVPVPATSAPVEVAEITPMPAPLPVAAPAPQAKPVNLVRETGQQAVTRVAANAAAPQPAERSIDVIGAWISQTLKLDQNSGSLVPPAPVARAQQGPAIDLMTSGAIANADAGTDQGEIGWVVQIGATPSQKSAETLLASATTNITGLNDYRPHVERFEKNGRTFYRARFIGFGDRQQADAMCGQLKQEKMSCLALKG